MPWAGGINAAQYNTMDINGDGAEDLVLFDRMVNKVITFVNDDNGYVYRPGYENLFPADVTNWMLLRDYNCDGKKDIFTGHVLGIKVYTNVTGEGQDLAFEHFAFYTGAGTMKSPVLLTQGSSLINLQLQFDDLPAIIDVDGDGDLDIFSIRYVGSSVEFHRNLSIESSWGCDSLAFTRITQRWGDFTECECGVVAFHGDECAGHGGRIKHAGGKTLLAMDANGDGSLDLVFSEAECSQLFLLPNAGTLSQPVINEVKPFPADHPVNLSIFPAAFYEDVDFDHIRDLIVAPNIYSKVSLSNNLERSNWFYKNNGSDAQPSLSFVQDNLLQDDMIDVGDNSVPAFTDHDGDGDYDMFISRNNLPTRFGIGSSILLYENTGTRSAPRFRLVTDDYLSFSDSEFHNLKIQFADMNRDNAIDLTWTATRLTDNRTNLYYILNTGRNALDVTGPATQVDFPLTSNENLFLADVDGDGHTDILAGRSNGAVEFWKNAGSMPSPQFTLENGDFLLSTSTGLKQSPSCFIHDLNGDGRKDLAYGDQSGLITIIDDYIHNAGAAGVTDIILDPISKAYNAYNLGGRVRAVAVNLFDTNKPAIVTGNTLGGLQVLRNENEFALYPNPAAKEQIINIEVDKPTVLRIFTLTGVLAGVTMLEPGQEPIPFELPRLAPGLYIFRFDSGNHSFSRKVVIR